MLVGDAGRLPGEAMRLLLVDNHDSYTFNLFQMLAAVSGTRPTVVANDAERWDRLDPADYDAAVISPGPGRPQRARDTGRAASLLRRSGLPLLGVCLGHQIIAHETGAQVALAPAPRHGHLTRVSHDGTGLFRGLPPRFTAVRYHSLAAVEPLPRHLRATAWAEDGVLMGLAHRTRPWWGVQFHPESIASEYGREILANFLRLARPSRFSAAPSPPAAAPAAAKSRGHGPRRFPPEVPGRRSARIGGDVLHWCALDGAVDTERLFAHRHARNEYAFWLDSSRTDGQTARFSFLGAPEGPRGEVLSYRVGAGEVTVTPGRGADYREAGTVFDVLHRRVAARPAAPPEGLPFDFTGGYVGYLGYELKAHCGGTAVHRAATPDALFLRIDRFVAVDHAAGRTYAVARAAHSDGEQARRWVDETAGELAHLPPVPEKSAGAGPPPRPEPGVARDDYLARVKECLGHLAAGESYEICLTNRLRSPAPADDTAFYRALRRANPAPYGALLRLGELAVHSASPERFLRITPEGRLDSRPIKGTASRASDPRTDAELREALRSQSKTRAENLMIVDLLRNDLGRVCEVGSVEVPEFMYTRSYATVHQLISTIQGRLRGDVGPVRAVQACFPAGSMTGAPKVRTMELIDALEDDARGVYSGALGYLGYEGTADLSVVIRTAVRRAEELLIGAGGAVVLDSDPAEEYAEMLLKAQVPLRGFC